MNFIEICQAVVRRAGISGGNKVYPSDVVGQTGRMALVVDYVQEATKDIETMWNDWTFMRREVDFEIPADTPSFDPTSVHSDVDRLNLLSITARDFENRTHVAIKPWLEERVDRVLSYETTSDLPNKLSVDHGGVIHFNPMCDHEFILRSEVVLSPATLAVSTDEPNVPLNFRDAIVHRALIFNYEAEEAEYLRQTADLRYQDWLLRMEERFLPMNSYRHTQTAEAEMTMVTQ